MEQGTGTGSLPSTPVQTSAPVIAEPPSQGSANHISRSVVGSACADRLFAGSRTVLAKDWGWLSHCRKRVAMAKRAGHSRPAHGHSSGPIPDRTGPVMGTSGSSSSKSSQGGARLRPGTRAPNGRRREKARADRNSHSHRGGGGVASSPPGSRSGIRTPRVARKTGISRRDRGARWLGQELPR